MNETSLCELLKTLFDRARRGPVVTCVGIGWRVFERHEGIRSCGEVNDLIVWFLGEGVRIRSTLRVR